VSLRACYHEVGHALVTRALGRRVELIAACPDGGVTRQAPLAADASPEEIERGLVAAFAGEIAEGYAPPAPSALEVADWNGGEALVAGLLALRDVEPERPSDEDAIEHYRQKIGDEAVERARMLSVELVGRLHDLGRLEAVADRLYLVGVLTGDDLETLLDAPAT